MAPPRIYLPSCGLMNLTKKQDIADFAQIWIPKARFQIECPARRVAAFRCDATHSMPDGAEIAGAALTMNFPMISSC